MATLMVLLGAACGDSDEWDIVDTTGTKFHYSCTDDCSISVQSNDCGSEGSATGSAILQICSKVDGVIYTSNCRPVACTDDDGCRTSFDIKHSCVHGICQVASEMLDVVDLQVLCLADVPRASMCAEPPFNDLRADQVKASCPGDDASRICANVPQACRQR